MYTSKYDELPKWLKLLVQFFLGSLVGGVYRILRFLETKNTVTLVVAILNFVGLGFIFWIIDFVTMLTQNKISVLAD